MGRTHRDLFCVWLFIAGMSRLKPAEFFRSSAVQKPMPLIQWSARRTLISAATAWFPSHHTVSPSHQLCHSSTSQQEKKAKRSPALMCRRRELCCTRAANDWQTQTHANSEEWWNHFPSHKLLHKKNNKATDSLEPNFIKEKPVVQVLRTNAYLWMQWSTQVRIQ